MATELASAYVTIIPSLKGASRTISDTLSGVDTSGIGKKSGKLFSSGIVGASKKGFGIMLKSVAGVGLAVKGLALGGGISRALKIEQAQYKFKNMGLDVDKTMASCSEAVNGTAYGLDAAATVASSLGASGVKSGKQMTAALKGVAGMAAMSGRSMEDIGLIWGKVAATGKLQGDELNQFAENGVNALAALSKYLGKSQTETREMIKEGKIDFNTFSKAMTASFGDAAKGANETFSGAMANVQAALSRVGAKFAAPALSGLQKIFVALIPAIDAVSKALDPIVTSFTNFVNNGVKAAVPAIEAFTKTLSDGGSFIDAFKASFDKLPETVQRVVAAIGAIGGALGAITVGSKLAQLGTAAVGLAGKIKPVSNAMARFKEGAAIAASGSDAAKNAMSVFGGASGKLGMAFGGLNAKVAAAGGGIKGFATVLGGALTGPVGIVVGVIAALAAAFVYLWKTNDTFRAQMTAIGQQLMSSLKPAIDSIKAAISSFVSSVMPVVISTINAIVPILKTVIQAVAGIAAVVIPVIAEILAQVLPAVAEIISVVLQVVSAIASFLMPVINALLGVVQAVWPVIQAVITTVMNVIKNVIKTITSIIKGDWNGAWEGIKGIASSVWNGIKSIVSAGIKAAKNIVTGVLKGLLSAWSSAWKSASSKLSSIWDSMKSAVRNKVNGIKNIVGKLPDSIKGFFSNAGSWLIDAGKNIIQGLWDGIKGAKDWLAGKLGGLGEFIADHKGPKSYDLKLLVPNGEWIMQSLATGMGNGMSLVRDTLSNVTSGITAGVEVSPFDSASGYGRYAYAGATAAGDGGVTYNVYFNDNTVNDDEEIKASFNDLMRTLKRKGAM